MQRRPHARALGPPPTTWSGGLSGRRTPPGRRSTTHSAPQPTAQPSQPSLHSTAQQTGAQHSTPSSTHQRARSTADARATPAHSHAQHARAARHRSAPHRAHFPSAAAAQHSTVNRHTTQPIIQPTPARAQHRRRTRDSNTHARTARARRTPAQRHTQSTLAHIISSSRPATAHISHTRAHTPHYRLAYCSRPREPQGPESRLEALRDPDPSRPQADSLKACKHQAD